MHDTGKVFFSLFCWRVVPKQQKHISVRKNFLRSQRYGECFTLIEGFRNSDDRTQNTEAWCLYFSKFCAKKHPRLMGQKRTQNQRQEAVLHADTPNPTAPNIKEIEISEFWTGRDWCSWWFWAWSTGHSNKYTQCRHYQDPGSKKLLKTALIATAVEWQSQNCYADLSFLSIFTVKIHI